MENGVLGWKLKVFNQNSILWKKAVVATFETRFRFHFGLERAYKKSGHIYKSSSYKRKEKSISGIHYLTRGVKPSLISRLFSVSNKENMDDGDDAKMNNPSKRKVVANESGDIYMASETNADHVSPPPPT
ncbi:hypothetical protein FRACYDRAFT_243980 [Fragilariopsis cylindrus CCMP1102]|uniref:Uncharacterized protein n=1 Tax=Fragilariopsis cylindrus CCMP1102 TaxID=635003 RepID=A0A1E7F4D8_9STRA|nr:hypothetical protein FRACYDRAFT_243980 [Fragilariopsis cylindrus CCMP1102]|eukprot:OEU12723.1 hypothetical protein FRACYDRAFT_243980 [Fragilariopsis cylindrus CCMP1102]